MAVDFKRDGKLDLAVSNLGSDYGLNPSRHRDGTFQAKVDYATASMPQGVAVGGYNGDGKLDLAVNDVNCVNFPSCGPGMVSHSSKQRRWNISKPRGVSYWTNARRCDRRRLQRGRPS